jgi:hypothetical protein
MNKRAKIAGRLKALFPKANLSTKRIDVITAKLESKVSDGADDTAIDEIVNQANDFMDFEALAKEDDRVRTLEANQKKGDESGDPPKDDPKNDPPKDDTPEWAKALLIKVDQKPIPLQIYSLNLKY